MALYKESPKDFTHTHTHTPTETNKSLEKSPDIRSMCKNQFYFSILATNILKIKLDKQFHSQWNKKQLT